MAGGGMTVAAALNEAQRSISGHRKLARLLTSRLASEGPEKVLRELAPCIAHLMLVFQRDSSIERAIRFVVTFVTLHDEAHADAQEALLEGLLSWLAPLSRALDKSVRFRACQIIAGVFSHAGADLELSDDVIEDVSRAMRLRLRDKVPQVRAQAARALARLQDPGERRDFSADPVTQAYRDMVGSDRNKDVRKVVLASMAVSEFTLPDILVHTRDTTDAVRRTAYLVLASKVPMASLSIAQRCQVLHRGLRDRAGPVKAAAGVLLRQWFASCAHDCAAFLRALDVQAYEDQASLALEHIMETGLAGALQIVTSLVASGHPLSRACAPDAVVEGEGKEDAAPLAPEEALLWRVACVRLTSEAKTHSQAAARAAGTEATLEAAEATRKLDALEAALPPTPGAFVALLERHVVHGTRFATRQMLGLACACMDFADHSSREAAVAFLERMLAERPEGDEGREGGEGKGGLYCAGNDGRWERALVRFGVALHGSSDAATEMCRAVLSSHRTLTREGDEAEAHVQACMLASTVLEGSPAMSLAPATMDALVRELALPAVQHDAIAVRREGVKLLGSVMVLGAPPKTQHAGVGMGMGVSIAAAALARDHTQVKTEAVRCLMDVALLHGPMVLESACEAWKALEASGQNRKERENESESEDGEGKEKESDFGAPSPSPSPIAAMMDLLEAKQWDEIEGPADDVALLRRTLVEGFAKLLVNNARYRPEAALRSREERRLFERLAFLHFASAGKPGKEGGEAEGKGEGNAEMQQCLSVFFDVYGASRAQSKAYDVITGSVIPCVTRAVGMQIKKSVLNTLVKFLGHLIQRGATWGVGATAAAAAAAADPTHRAIAAHVAAQERLAMDLVCEALSLLDEEEADASGALPLLKLLPKLDWQHVRQDVAVMVHALLSRVPAKHKGKELLGLIDRLAVLVEAARKEEEGEGGKEGERGGVEGLKAKAIAFYEGYTPGGGQNAGPVHDAEHPGSDSEISNTDDEEEEGKEPAIVPAQAKEAALPDAKAAGEEGVQQNGGAKEEEEEEHKENAKAKPAASKRAAPRRPTRQSTRRALRSNVRG